MRAPTVRNMMAEWKGTEEGLHDSMLKKRVQFESFQDGLFFRDSSKQPPSEPR
jgi:hypothetical protein